MPGLRGLLAAIADGHGTSIPRIVLAWRLTRPGVTGLVLGARTDDQLRDNLAATDLTLSEEETEKINEASQPPAYYPNWHRALNAADRPDPAEQPYLGDYHRALQHKVRLQWT